MAAYQEVQKVWATAFQNYKGDLMPQFVTGSSGQSGNGGLDFMQIMSAKAARDLSLEMKVQLMKKDKNLL